MEPGEGGTYSSVNLLYGAHTGQEGHMKAGGEGTLHAHVYSGGIYSSFGI